MMIGLVHLPTESFAESNFASVQLQELLRLQNEVQKRDLAHSKPWLRLVHYKRSWTGNYKSEVDGPAFFLSSIGKVDPEDELLKTIEALLQPMEPGDEEHHAQCRFPARRDWVFETLSVDATVFPRHPCSKAEAWKKRLDPTRVSLIFASSYLNNAASMFGHTFIKFHSRENSEDRDLLNYGVSFAASTGSDGGVPFAVLGLIGGYRGYFSLLPYHQTLLTYANLEGRDIWEYRLSFTEKEVGRLLNHLLELQQSWFDYFFFDENCSYQLLTIFEVARPELDLSSHFRLVVIPADTVRKIVKVPGLVEGTHYRPSLQSEFDASLEDLNFSERSLVASLVRAKDGDEIQFYESELKAQPPTKQIAIADSALAYASLVSTKNPDQYRERNYKLKLARASTGIAGQSAREKALERATRPEQGHEPAQIHLNSGVLNIGKKSSRAYLATGGRMAYHHLLSNDVGYLQNTQLEAGRFQVRHYLDPERTVFQEFIILDLISTNPLSRFFQPISWRFKFGLHRPEDLGELSPMSATAEGGVGYTFALLPRDQAVWISFLEAGGDAAPALRRDHRIGVGVESQILFKYFRYWNLGLGASWRHYFTGQESHVMHSWLRNTLPISKNFEVRLNLESYNNRRDGQTWALWHFIF